MTIAFALLLSLAGGSAEEISREALTLYREGRLVEAAQKFLAAYEMSGHPTQLRNAAKAFEEGDRLEEALENWWRYVEHDIPDDKRAEAEQHIASIEARQARIRAAPPPPPPPAARPPPPPPPALVVPTEPPPSSNATIRWTIAGVGAAAVVTGIVLYLSGWSTFWTHQGQDPMRPEVSRDEANAARTRSGAGLVVGAAGALAIGGAFVFFGD